MLALLLLTAALALTEEPYQQGVALFEKGHYAEAAPLLAEAARRDPKNAQKWKALGVALAAQKKYAEATEPLRRACELNPELPDACYYFARNEYAQNRFEISIQTLKRLLKSDPQPARIYLALAQNYEGLALAQEAERHFREALRSNSDRSRLAGDFDPRLHYGLFLIRAGRASEAIPYLRECVQDSPRHVQSRIELARALLYAGKPAEAAEHLNAVLAMAPENVQARVLLQRARAALEP
jgi:tetratricopeptide (TPR) repeat protein